MAQVIRSRAERSEKRIGVDARRTVNSIIAVEAVRTVSERERRR
jgi:hypothetical protein